MDLKAIQSEISEIKRYIEKQIEYYNVVCEKTHLNSFFDDKGNFDCNGYFDSIGKNSLSFEEIKNMMPPVIARYKELGKTECLTLGDFEDMRDCAIDIQNAYEETNHPENMDNYYNEMSEKYQEVVAIFDEIIDEFDSFENVIELLREIVDKISEIA